MGEIGSGGSVTGSTTEGSGAMLPVLPPTGTFGCSTGTFGFTAGSLDVSTGTFGFSFGSRGLGMSFGSVTGVPGVIGVTGTAPSGSGEAQPGVPTIPGPVTPGYE